MAMVNDEIAQDVELKADEIKAKLLDPSLSANQRKKCRKKLSRLFNMVYMSSCLDTNETVYEILNLMAFAWRAGWCSIVERRIQQ